MSKTYLPLGVSMALVLAGGLAAQTAPRTVTTARLGPNEEIRLDGKLDEAAWQRATPASGFLQVDPQNGRPASEDTEVRVLIDEDRLVFGVTAHDSDPSAILANTLQRDQPFIADDRFMLTLDTYRDGRSGYFFEINPAGGMSDGLLGGGQQNGGGGGGGGGGAAFYNGQGSPNKAWDGIWNARVARDAGGWTAEIEIPFRTLNFNPKLESWGINFQRTIRRKNEETRWNGFARNQQVWQMAEAGVIQGITDVSQGMGLDVKPYVIGKANAVPATAPGSDYHGDAGADISYNITPNLRANLTINTDFAETEVDDRQVNLTRFPLLFPEKREFFLQGSGNFGFAGDPNVFFSRRIGLNDGAIQPIDAGLKLIGQLGAYDVGALQVRTRAYDRSEDLGGDLPGEDFTVLRARRRFGSQSHFGFIYSMRDQRGTDTDILQTAGTDLRLSTSNFMGKRKNVMWRSSYIWTTDRTPGVGRSDKLSSALDYPNDVWNGHMQVDWIGKDYDPAVGFRFRSGIREYQGNFFWNPRPRASTVRQLNFGFAPDLITDPSNNQLSHKVMFKPIGVNLQSGDNASFTITPNWERLDADFTLPGKIVLRQGNDYSYMRYNVSAGTADQRKLSTFGSVEWGTFYSGTSKVYSLNGTVRPWTGFSLNLNGSESRLRLAEGSVNAAVFQAKLGTQLSPWISLNNNIQYDNQSRGLGWQARFRWTLSPGNDLFFVYSHNWIDGLTGGFYTNDHTAATKFVFTRRF